MSTQLTCTVQSYPAVQNHHVIIYNGNTRIISRITVTEKADETDVDVSVINLNFASVQRSDFGNYTVDVDNGVGSISIALVLQENGIVLFHLFCLLLLKLIKTILFYLLITHVPIINI